MADSTMIEAHGLRKSFGPTVALDGIDLEVPAGSILGVLGPNGAGKTTAVRILTTLALPDGGSARVAGHDVVTEPSDVRRNVGVTAQDATLDEVLTGRENLVMIGCLSGLRRAHARFRARELLDEFDLMGAADRVLKGYSGGMRRRLDLAAGLVTRPPVLFLDEPTTGLDPAARREMWEMIEGLRDAGKTVLLTTHYMDEADHLADRIIILRHGEIVAQGTSDELRDSLGDVTHIAFRVPADARLDLLGMEAEVSTHLDGALVRIPSKSVQADLGRVLHWADRQALDLADLEVVRPTLDDVFVELAEAPPEEARGQ